MPSARLHLPRDATVGSSRVKVIWLTLALGVFSQFCYVGGQESTATNFSEYLGRVMPSLDPDNQLAIGHTAFALSRFIAVIMNIWLKPRFILLFFYLGAIAFAAACMNGVGATPVALILLLMFFEGPLFPMIYAQPLRGMGQHTKDAAVLLTAATSGGAIFPAIMFSVKKAVNLQYAFCVTVAAFAAGALYPIYLNLYPSARQISDPVRDQETRRASQIDRGTAKRKGFSLRRNRASSESDLPTVEQREQITPPTLPAQSHHSASSQPRSRHSSEEKRGSGSLDFQTTPAWLGGAESGAPYPGSTSPETHDAEPGPSNTQHSSQQNKSVDFQTKPAWLDFATNEGSDDRDPTPGPPSDPPPRSYSRSCSRPYFWYWRVASNSVLFILIYLLSFFCGLMIPKRWCSGVVFSSHCQVGYLYIVL